MATKAINKPNFVTFLIASCVNLNFIGLFCLYFQVKHPLFSYFLFQPEVILVSVLKFNYRNIQVYSTGMTLRGFLAFYKGIKV